MKSLTSGLCGTPKAANWELSNQLGNRREVCRESTPPWLKCSLAQGACLGPNGERFGNRCSTGVSCRICGALVIYNLKFVPWYAPLIPVELSPLQLMISEPQPSSLCHARPLPSSPAHPGAMAFSIPKTGCELQEAGQDWAGPWAGTLMKELAPQQQ